MVSHKTRKHRKITLDPKHEAALLAYIVLYYNCDKATCWNIIGKAIEESNMRVTRVVYRGHSKDAKRILNTTPFFSTSPVKGMAELFVEKDWSSDSEKRVGHLFKIHLMNIPVLNTRNINFTFSDKVFSELKKINRNREIQKGDRTYTFEEYRPKIKEAVYDLIHSNSKQDGEELLVLNGGTFYANKDLTKKGFKPLNGYFETWYSK